MPKGEHFKKPNPRIHQVSFKLNATELAEMKRIISASGKSLPQFLRDIIFTSEDVVATPPEKAVVKAEVEVGKIDYVDKEIKPAVPTISKTVEKLKEVKPKHEPRKDSNNQFSLF